MKRCAYCGTTRFGLIRRTGFYVRGLVVEQRQFCCAEHKRRYDESRATHARAALLSRSLLPWTPLRR